MTKQEVEEAADAKRKAKPVRREGGENTPAPPLLDDTMLWQQIDTPLWCGRQQLAPLNCINYTM